MDDVVEYGERGTRRWPAVAVVLLAVAAIGAASVASRRAARPAAHPSASASPSAFPVGPLETVPVDDIGDPFGSEWQLGPRETGTGLVLLGAADHGLRTLDLDSGATTTIGFPHPGPVRPVARVRDGWLVFAGPQCVPEDCAAAPLYAVRDAVLGGGATLVGYGDDAVYDDTRDTVWLTTVTAITGEGQDQRQTRTMQQRSLSGARVGSRTTLRSGERVLGVAPPGPVVGDRYAADAPITVVDEATRVRRTVATGHFVAVSGDVVLWTGACRAQGESECPLYGTHVRSGRRREVAVLASPPILGAADPTGQLLAVAYAAGIATTGADVVGLSTGTVEHVRGMFAPPEVATLTWAPDGAWLVLTYGAWSDERFEGHVVALWRPGSDLAHAAPGYRGAPDDAFAVSYMP
jgi:hypothetical protein